MTIVIPKHHRCTTGSSSIPGFWERYQAFIQTIVASKIKEEGVERKNFSARVLNYKYVFPEGGMSPIQGDCSWVLTLNGNLEAMLVNIRDDANFEVFDCFINEGDTADSPEGYFDRIQENLIQQWGLVGEPLRASKYFDWKRISLLLCEYQDEEHIGKAQLLTYKEDLHPRVIAAAIELEGRTTYFQNLIRLQKNTWREDHGF